MFLSLALMAFVDGQAMLDFLGYDCHIMRHQITVQQCAWESQPIFYSKIAGFLLDILLSQECISEFICLSHLLNYDMDVINEHLKKNVTS